MTRALAGDDSIPNLAATLIARLLGLKDENRLLRLRVDALQRENDTLLGRLQRLVERLAKATHRDQQLALFRETTRVNAQLAAKNLELFGLSRSEERGEAASAPETPSAPEAASAPRR